MKHQATITIPKPCSENWDQMTPVEQGRFCASCQQKVIDFTLLSDAQILDIFKRAKGNMPCGRFLNSQLNRELVPPSVRYPILKNWYARIAASLLLVQTAITSTWAQSAKPETVITSRHKKHRHHHEPNIEICGRATESLSRKPITGLTVTLQELNMTIITDSLGFFRFYISPDTMLPAMLTFSATSDSATAQGADIPNVVIPSTDINKEVNIVYYAPRVLSTVEDITTITTTTAGAPMYRPTTPEITTVWVKPHRHKHRKQKKH